MIQSRSNFARRNAERDERDRRIARLNREGHHDFAIANRLGLPLLVVESALARPARELRPW